MKSKKVNPTKAVSKTLIEVKNVVKEFGKNKKKVVALKGISFDIKDGENLALIGSNGAGKTTIVEIIAGLNKPTTGEIIYHFDDKNENINRNLGIQFQDSTYPAGLTVKRIISFILDAYGSSMTKDELKDIIDRFGVTSFYHQNAKSLSGGQSQRLNVLLALLHRPKVVFLDELSTGLDIRIRNEIKVFVKDYAKKYNMNIVLISHDMNEVEYLADRAIIMKDGEIVNEVKIKDLAKKHIKLEDYITKYI